MATELQNKGNIVPIEDFGVNRTQKDKFEKALARLWNDPDGKSENRNWKILTSSGKGFYDRSAEFLVLHKKSGVIFLCTAHTSYARDWKSPDYVTIEGVQMR